MNDLNIGVVITTHNRPLEVVRAIESVLSQTLICKSIVVVIDGRKEPYLDVINSYRSGVKFIFVGYSDTIISPRNAGVLAIEGEVDYIAFLDDDDYWLSNKLERVALAIKNEEYPDVISHKVFVNGGKVVWPRRILRSRESVAEYLFMRPSLRSGDTFMQTSTLTVKRASFLEVRFDDCLKKHQDWDFVIRMDKKGFKFLQIDEILGIYTVNLGVHSISKVSNIDLSLEWGKKVLGDEQPIILPDFRLTVISSQYVASKNLLGLIRNLARAFMPIRSYYFSIAAKYIIRLLISYVWERK
ncbi:hypothetical protein CBQ26_01800 [Deinococcus indicus]|uniref:Glycosyltransferase 2-like domain-containing protein n=1 Tax=Deinococcus indicus TaxID=223556 RepID=A0A246BSH5_9DEIO|nr:glycosyltransferase family 2 protein [Deinococcus indicus]OWL98621.1 hypothetical protein CBQ26_01800 [Deinococcus indicus]